MTIQLMDFPPGWTCEVVTLRMERYLAMRLPLSEALAVAEHVEACLSCAQRITLLAYGGEAAAGSAPGHQGRRARSPESLDRHRGGPDERKGHGR